MIFDFIITLLVLLFVALVVISVLLLLQDALRIDNRGVLIEEMNDPVQKEKSRYVDGDIDENEFERRIERALEQQF